jgi:hypothetical protein
MRLLCVAAHYSTVLPLKFVPFLNQYITAPLFNFLVGSSMYVPRGDEALLIADHPDQYYEMEYFIPKSNFSKVSEVLSATINVDTN